MKKRILVNFMVVKNHLNPLKYLENMINSEMSKKKVLYLLCKVFVHS